VRASFEQRFSVVAVSLKKKEIYRRLPVRRSGKAVAA